MNSIVVLYLGDDPEIIEYLKTYAVELGWKNHVISAKADKLEKPTCKPDVCLLDLEYLTLENALAINLLEDTQSKKILLADSDDNELYLRYRKYLPAAYVVCPVSEIQLRAQIETVVISYGQQKANQVLQSWQEEENLHNAFYIKNNNKLLKVKQSDILAVIADGNYCLIITPQRRYAVKISLRKIKMKLSALLFKQIHRNYIVQLPKIESVDLSSNEVYVNGELYPIGGSFRQGFLDRLARI